MKNKYRLFSLVVLFSLACISLEAQHAPSRAYQVKAAFLYNFSQFVDWPADAFKGPGEPFVIGLLGANPFGSYLNELVRGEKISGRPIIVKQITGNAEIRNCHILFINRDHVSEALEVAREQSILTVGDDADFALKGGMICFFIENNKVRFKINPSAAKAAKLNISSKLLRLADIVE